MKIEVGLVEFMQWTPALETGITVIDSQHKRIVDYINQLDAARRTGNPAETMEALDGLVDYTATHFAFEEEMQAKAGYEFVNAHQRVHQIFMKRVASFRARAEAGEDVTEELLAMLKVWLSSHIKGDDRDYVDIVRNFIGAPQPEHAGWLNSTLKRFFG